MAFLKNDEHDVFVSYKIMPEEKTYQDKKERSWTEIFVDLLSLEVNKSLRMLYECQTPDVDIWLDRELRKNKPLEKSLKESAGSSNLLLIFMSQGYLNSEWCGREKKWFKDAIGSKSLNDERIFIVEIEPVNRGENDKLVPYKFYDDKNLKDGSTRPYGWPIPYQVSEDYNKMLVNLAADIAKQLKEIKDQHEPDQPPPPPPKLDKIFLAYSSPDLITERTKLLELLKNKGLDVVPEYGIKNLELEHINKALNEQLPECGIFVQILSENSGFGIVKQQGDAARKMKRRVIQWCPEDIDLNTGDASEYRCFLSTVNSAPVNSLTDFSDYIINPPDPVIPAIIEEKARIFVKAERIGPSFAGNIQNDIVNKGLECHTLKKMKPSEFGVLRERLSTTCDGVIFIWEHGEETQTDAQKEWIIREIDYLKELVRTRKRKISPFVSIVEAPPPGTSLVPFDNNIPIFDFSHNPEVEENDFYSWLDYIKQHYQRSLHQE